MYKRQPYSFTWVILFLDPLLDLSLLYLPVVCKFIFKKDRVKVRVLMCFMGGPFFYCIPQKKYNILDTLVVG